MSETPSISSAELRARLEGEREHAILDVRREGDFAKGHLFYACNIPRSLLELRLERLLPRPDVPIAIVAKGEHAHDVGEVLAGFGYSDVRLLAGELDGWTRDGGALFSGMNVPSKAFGEFIEREAETPHVEPATLAEVLKTEPDSVLFDCRPFGEYDAMSIPGAINCPGVELAYRFAANVPRATTRVYVNCAGRTRSIIGAQSLIDCGVQNPVAAVRDGAMGWKLAGFALEQGANTHALPPDEASLDRTRSLVASRAVKAGVRAATAVECAELLADGTRTTYLFDVRDPSEHRAGHLKGAISAPGGQLIQTFDHYVAVHNARIILADSDGIRAPVVAVWLRQMGVRDVITTQEVSADSRESVPTPKLDRLLAGGPEILVEDARAALARGAAVLLDLAPSKEYRNNHIPGSRFAERHEVERIVDACPPSTFVVLTSEDGQLARVVAASLAHRGVAALCGGTRGWAALGLPFARGTETLPQAPTDVFYKPYDSTENATSAMRDYLEWERGLLERLGKEPGVRFSRMN